LAASPWFKKEIAEEGKEGKEGIAKEGQALLQATEISEIF
jgi:hypothetical protein